METVVIYRLGSLGDTIVCLPCFHSVARRYPNARRVVVTNKPVSVSAPRLSEVLTGTGLIHGTIDYNVGSRSPFELARLWFRLRGLQADTLVYLAASRGTRAVTRDLRFFRSCGITNVVGAPLTDDLQSNRLDPLTGEEEQECIRLTRTIAELGTIDLNDRAYWDLRLNSQEKTVAHEALGPFQDSRFLAINMGGKSANNDWGEANWSLLLSELRLAFRDLQLIFVGATSDADRAERMSALKPGQSLNLCGKLTPRETAAVLSRASLFIGHDSGPLHLAAACNVRCVGLFSNQQKARKWYPYGMWHRIIQPSGPISTLPVHVVKDAVCDALAEELSPCHQ